MSILIFFVGDSGRFSKRANDKTHQRRLKGGERICKLYVTNPDGVLQIVNKDLLLFRIRSETNPDTTYNVSLSCHYCDCPTIITTCKHIIGLQLILKKYFSTDFKLFELVDSQMPSEEPDVMTFNLEDSPIIEENASTPIEMHNYFEEK